MKRFLAKIGRFFWSWGFLKFVIWTITLVALFYVEEDWRGARDWAHTKAKWEAKGESFDFNRLIPPPIPDSENLGAIPLFKLEVIKNSGGSFLDPVALRKASRGSLFDNNFPPSNFWARGEFPDITKIRQAISSKYLEVFKSAPTSDDPLVQLDALYPWLDALRAAAATRPFCRFQFDDTAPSPDARSLGLVTGQLYLSKILTFHAVLALEAHQSDLALADLRTIYKLASGAQEDPSFIGTLISNAMYAVSNAIIYDGLALHAWSDSQLTEIDQLLEPIIFWLGIDLR